MALLNDLSIEREQETVLGDTSGACTLDDLILHGSSVAIQRLKEHIETAANGSCHVLVHGSIGDGAMVIADEIHRRSPSRNRPLIRLDCSSRFTSEAEAVLFGAAGIRGALGIRRATVVLENVDGLSPDLQARVAEAMQAQARDIDRARVIATSALDLPTGSFEGGFNRSLVLLLNSFRIRLPRLSERQDDIPGIAQIIIDSCADSNVIGLTPKAAVVLKNYPWVNIDRLTQCVEFATHRALGPKVDVSDLPTEVIASAARSGDHPVSAPTSTSEAREPGVLTMSERERLAIIEALRITHGNKLRAAMALGIGKTTLYRKVKQFGLE